MLLNKSLLRIAVASSLLAVSSLAAAEEAASPYTLTANVYLVSDYYFRGITQTWHQAALQGGVDLSHSSGLYAGIWSSNVSGNQYAGGSQEIDVYGGYNGKINADLSYTAGVYGYFYPGADYKKSAAFVYPSQSYNTVEVNVGATWKWVSAKYYYSVTDYFGLNTDTGYDGSSKGTGYLDLSATYNIADDIAITGHFGMTMLPVKTNGWTSVGGSNDPSYNDFKLGVTKTFKESWNVGLAYVQASNAAFYDTTSSYVNAADTADIGAGKFILSAGRAF